MEAFLLLMKKKDEAKRKKPPEQNSSQFGLGSPAVGVAAAGESSALVLFPPTVPLTEEKEKEESSPAKMFVIL